MSSKQLFLPALFLAALILLTSSLSAFAASRPEQQIIQLQKKYQQLRSLEFDFSQTTQTGGRVKQGSGNAVFYRPTTPNPDGTSKGILRWNYTNPNEQTIINDGASISIYTPQDKQLIVSPVEKMDTDITSAIFTGTKSLLGEFEARPADKLFFLNDAPTGLEAVQLTPRQPHPQIKRVQLWINSDLTIYRLLLEDHFSALTELTFTRVRFNTLPQGNLQQEQALIKLDLLPGTETIRQ